MPNGKGGLFGGLNFDFGLPKGLAVRVDTRQDIANIRRNEIAERQKRIDSQTKAKMLTDDLQFGNASNPWDHKLLKDFTESKLNDIGKFVTNNPDWDTDPGKLLQLNQLKRSLIDNDIVLRSERIKAHKDAMDKWLNDPKNKEMVNFDEVLQKRKEYENYINTGSIDGVEGNNIEFVWQQPGLGIDLSGEFANRARTVGRQGSKDISIGNRYFNEKYVTREDMMTEALNMINDQGQVGVAIRKQFSDLKENDGVPENMTINQWVFDNLWNNRLEDKRDLIGSDVYKSRNGSAGSGNAKPYKSYFFDPLANPTNKTLEDLIDYNKDGSYTTLQGFKIPIRKEDGTVEYTAIESSRNMRIPADVKQRKEIIKQGEEIGVLTQYKIPLEDTNYIPIVEELGSHGLINSNEFAQWMGNNFDEAEDIEINDAKTIKKWTEEDKDGNEKHFLLVNAFTPHLFNSVSQVQHDQRYGTKSTTPFDPNVPGEEAIVIAGNDGRLHRFVGYDDNGQELWQTIQ